VEVEVEEEKEEMMEEEEVEEMEEEMEEGGRWKVCGSQRRERQYNDSYSHYGRLRADSRAETLF